MKLLLQELEKSIRLIEGKVDLRLNNGARVIALAIRTSYFILSNGPILELYNYYFVPVF